MGAGLNLPPTGVRWELNEHKAQWAHDTKRLMNPTIGPISAETSHRCLRLAVQEIEPDDARSTNEL